MNIKNKVVLFCALIVLYYIQFIRSQTQTSTTLTLQQCIEIAIQNNLSLKISDINVNIAKNNELQSRAQILPSINGTAMHTYQYGRTVDRFTNTFANTNVLSQNFFVTAQWTIWSGLSQYNTIQSNKMNVLSAQENLAQQKNDLMINVATAYVNVLLSQDILEVNKKQFEVSKQNFERTQILVEQGGAAVSTLKDIESQVANDELNVINAKNNLELNLLVLKQLLNFPSTQNIDIVRPDIVINSDILTQYTAEDIYNMALKTQPSVKSREYQLKSYEYMLKASRGKRSPVLNISASIGTGYSGLARRVIGYQLRTDTLGMIPGFGPLVYAQQVPILEKTPFMQQYKDNFNQIFGFSLNVPLFNGLSVHTSIENAKLNVLNAKYNFDLNNQQLYKNIVQAYMNAQAALVKYQASQKSYEASLTAHNINDNKYQQGVISFFDYLASRNRMISSHLNMLQAKYDLFFKIKILEFYTGKPFIF